MQVAVPPDLLAGALPQPEIGVIRWDAVASNSRPGTAFASNNSTNTICVRASLQRNAIVSANTSPFSVSNRPQ